MRTIHTAKDTIKIGIVGKYFGTGNFILADSYISVIEAVKHAVYALKCRPEIVWLDAEMFDKNTSKSAKNNLEKLKELNGIVVPGGFGSRGVEGKINVIRFARENKIPYFGLCYGMQLATIEFARSALKLARAHTTEVDSKTPHPVIDILPEQKKNVAEKNYGATMRLGAYPAILKPDTIAYEAYSASSHPKTSYPSLRGLKKQSYLNISERHRHRYEFNNDYKDVLEKAGMRFSGLNEKDNLVEIVELVNHPWFVGTQFHPEFQSHPLQPHPLFKDFIGAALKLQKK